MTIAEHIGARGLGRGTFGGLLLTLLIHGALGYGIYVTQIKRQGPLFENRELITTHMVMLGRPRERFWLPNKQQPPQPNIEQRVIKVTLDPNAGAAPKEAPKLEDRDINDALKNALQRARNLQRANTAEEPPEGSLTGSALGMSNEAKAGDEYATKVFEAIRSHWNAAMLIDQATLGKLSATVRVRIDGDGTLLEPSLTKGSGNDIFDDSCIEAVKSTGKVPPPPADQAAKFKRGTYLVFDPTNGVVR